MTGLLEDIPRFVTSVLASVPGSGDAVAQFCFTEDFAGFNGHFPGAPVLPGIVQIMLAQYTATGGCPSRMARVNKCKFIHPVKPLDRVEVQTSVVQGHCYKATVSANGVRCATLVFELDI